VARRVYSAIGTRIARTGYDVTAGRAVVSTPSKLLLLAGSVGRLVASVPARAFSRRAHVPTTQLRFADVPQL
jgi:hypothetical protein